MRLPILAALLTLMLSAGGCAVLDRLFPRPERVTRARIDLPVCEDLSPCDSFPEDLNDASSCPLSAAAERAEGEVYCYDAASHEALLDYLDDLQTCRDRLKTCLEAARITVESWNEAANLGTGSEPPVPVKTPVAPPSPRQGVPEQPERPSSPDYAAAPEAE